MFKIRSNGRLSRSSIFLAFLAAGVLPLAASTSAPSMTDAGEAVVVSAAGNVIQPPNGANAELAAVYYHGYWATKEKCQQVVRDLLATGQYTAGGCNYFNSRPYYNTWRAWVDYPTCQDRVAPTSLTASAGTKMSLRQV